jgi:hypothetical protein
MCECNLANEELDYCMECIVNINVIFNIIYRLKIIYENRIVIKYIIRFAIASFLILLLALLLLELQKNTLCPK